MTEAQVAASHDAESRIMFSFSGILSFMAQAQIFFLLAKNSSSPEWHKCSDALRNAITLVEKLEPGELLTLDPILGVSVYPLARRFTLLTYQQLIWSHTLVLFGTGQPKPLSSESSSATDRDFSELIPATAVPQLVTAETPPKQHGSCVEKQFDLKANVAKMAQLNTEFLAHRFMAGTSSLCAKLAEHNW